MSAPGSLEPGCARKPGNLTWQVGALDICSTMLARGHATLQKEITMRQHVQITRDRRREHYLTVKGKSFQMGSPLASGPVGRKCRLECRYCLRVAQ